MHNHAAKVFNAENRDYVVELVKRLIQQCSEHLRSNEGLQSVLRKFEVVLVSISRKVISPVVQQVFRSKARSALAGFIGGLGRGTDAISMSPFLFWVSKVRQRFHKRKKSKPRSRLIFKFNSVFQLIFLSQRAFQEVEGAFE